MAGGDGEDIVFFDLKEWAKAILKAGLKVVAGTAIAGMTIFGIRKYNDKDVADTADKSFAKPGDKKEAILITNKPDRLQGQKDSLYSEAVKAHASGDYRQTLILMKQVDSVEALEKKSIFNTK